MGLNVLHFFIILIIYSLHIYGKVRPLWDQSPYVPPESFKHSCIKWLMYHNIKAFDTTNESSNRMRASERVRAFDPEMHVWAACYAYFISSFSLQSLLKWYDSPIPNFCNRLIPPDKETSYLSLQYAKLTCVDWIHYYGYDKENTELNKKMAYERNTKDDNVPHLLVSMYSRYAYELRIEDGYELNEDDKDDDESRKYETPLGFCQLIENTETPVHKEIQFMTLDTKKSCKEWIELSGYSDSEDYNLHNSIQKAMRQNHDVIEYLSNWAREYIDHLLNFEIGPMKPGAFCNAIGHPAEVEVYYDRK